MMITRQRADRMLAPNVLASERKHNPSAIRSPLPRMAGVLLAATLLWCVGCDQKAEDDDNASIDEKPTVRQPAPDQKQASATVARTPQQDDPVDDPVVMVDGRWNPTDDEWKRIVEEYRSSGQSQRAFAQTRGLNLSSLSRWARLLPREDERDKDNKYTGGPQQEGPPFYFHQDNHQFTGHETISGWDFDGPHKITRAGDQYTATELTDSGDREALESFARFIIDRTLFRSMLNQAGGAIGQPDFKSNLDKAQLRPVNADSYLLISAGVDGRYGTNDDITNFPLAVE
ncbi:MAG: hypothetical protein IID42_07010 [Planctomycetes bacterium]|nr:hypothetical protein [Planctomycetota bacterium]